jgi:4-diphosphocytidyl-2-C-methyl-D-erythritol kinase
LLGLDRLLATGCSRDELADMGLELGADVPLFIHDMAAAWATGIGEKLEVAVPLSGYRVLLVNPGIGVSTKWVYETFALTSGENIFNLSCSQKEHGEIGRPADFCKRPILPDELVNDLEAVTADKYSVINTIKQRLLAAGAVGAMMTGSGPTVFGLFSTDLYQQARLCSQELNKEYDQVYLVDPLV